MTQHFYIDGPVRPARDQRPAYVPDLGNIADLPICELPIAALGVSPTLRLIDCPKCLHRAVAAAEDRLLVLRERLALVEASS